ncbi:unnamed protein product [Sphagnum jensenii]|uniref:Uncharacterized protein n=2 Tax=Sphagnum jensenii TaxID=128206 RepID=A0ABP1A262_9BRYO
MSVAYQRWEIGAAASSGVRGYKKITTGSPQAMHQYGSEGVALLRRQQQQQQQQHPHDPCRPQEKECSSSPLHKAESTTRVVQLPETVPDEQRQCANFKVEPSAPLSPSSSSSSSIFDRRDLLQQSSCSSEDTTSAGDSEAQSAFRGPLHQMSALESSLPIKRPGLSKFFGGKSRSFSSLADVSSVSDLAKPNNPYAKRRRMGAGGGFSGASLDRHKTFYPRLSSAAGISKKPVTNKSSSSTLTIAVKLGGLTKQDRDSSSAADLPAFSSRTHGLTRTTPLRSFSLTDLPVVSNPSFSPFERSLAHQP